MNNEAFDDEVDLNEDCEPGPLGLVHDPDNHNTTEDNDTLEAELNDGREALAASAEKKSGTQDEIHSNLYDVRYLKNMFLQN